MAWYCTREDVMSAPDFKEAARNARQIDRAIASASAEVADLCHREFSPYFATNYFAWPNLTYARPWRLWLDEFELLSVSSITTGGVALDQTEYFLEPVNDPPFDRVEINLGSQASFTASDTFQRSVAITGWWGYSDNQEPVANLVSPVTSTATSLDVDNSENIGVGDTLVVNQERMTVTGKAARSSGQTVLVTIGASVAANTISVTDGAEFHQDEILLIDGERMLVLDIAGNTLVVKRSWDGSPLAAHASGATIYVVGWTLNVTRGAQGTTPQSHSLPTVIQRWRPPEQVHTLAIAIASDTVLQEISGYSRTVGSSPAKTTASVGTKNSNPAPGGALEQAKTNCYNAVGRKGRKYAV
jgi:hypothetical protein